MTIILATKRDSFAVLAADELHGRPLSRHPKVILHRSLPLAFAVGGCMWLRLSGKEASTRQHIEDFANQITSHDELVVSDLAARLRELVQPGVDEMNDTLQIFIALVRDDRADVGMQQVSPASFTDNPTSLYDHSRYVAPETVGELLQQRLGGFHDSQITDPAAVCDTARAIIRECIDLERSVSGGENKVIGDPIDVVLVTRQGAIDP